MTMNDAACHMFELLLKRPFSFRFIKLIIGGLLVIIYGAVLFACSTPNHTRILWPKLPDKPMLEFVGVYETSEDFEYSVFEKALFDLFGEKSQYFKLPYAVVANNDNDIYVSDAEGLKLVNQRDKTVKTIVSKNVVKQPLGLTIDSKGLLYLVDGKSRAVLQLDGKGRKLKQYGDERIFAKPSYIAVNERLARIYVSDKEKNQVDVFDLAGKLLFMFGKPGKGAGEFAFPQGVAIAPNNDLYIADTLNSRIQVFTADGLFLRSFGQPGYDYREFDAPRDLAFGPDGNLYIVDFRKALLYVYTPEGKLLLVIGDYKKRTNHPLGFSAPSSIHIDKFGKILIADILNNRFSVWQILTNDYLSNNPIVKDVSIKR